MNSFTLFSLAIPIIVLSAQKLPLLQGLGEVNVSSLKPQFIEETQTRNLSSLVGRHLPSHQGWTS